MQWSVYIACAILEIREGLPKQLQMQSPYDKKE